MAARGEPIVTDSIALIRRHRGSTDEVEEGRAFAPKFDADGLVTCVATDARSGDVLMVAHMNARGAAADHRDRRGLVFQPLAPRAVAQGRDSGHIQRVVEMRVDCDQDAVWIKVEQEGAGACHTGRRSCFYRAVPLGKSGAVTLEFRDARARRSIRRRSTARRSSAASRDIDRAALPRPAAIAARASNCRARSRCGRSYITPSMPTVPLPGLAVERGDDGARLGDRRRRSA